MKGLLSVCKNFGREKKEIKFLVVIRNFKISSKFLFWVYNFVILKFRC